MNERQLRLKLENRDLDDDEIEFIVDGWVDLAMLEDEVSDERS
jgi:hypothetical protein